MRQRTLGYALLLATLACGGAVEKRSDSSAESDTGPEALPKQRIALSTGISMAYLEAGRPRGEVVILLHGYTDTGRSWYPTMQHLTALRPDLHIVALDQRGHGNSSMPAAPACRHTPEACFRSIDFAADGLAFMDALGGARAVVVGHSMGSMVAQELALTHPSRIASIVLVATTGSDVANVALRDYVLAEPVEGSWKDALEAQGRTFPDDVYDLTPLDADPKAEAWMAANWVVDPVAPPASSRPACMKRRGSSLAHGLERPAYYSRRTIRPA